MLRPTAPTPSNEINRRVLALLRSLVITSTAITSTAIVCFATPLHAAPGPTSRGGFTAATGTIWYDSNRDGIHDPGELGIEGVEVYAANTSGAPVQFDTTDGNGEFRLEFNTNPYRVGIVQPQGLFLTLQDEGSNADDSDFDRSTWVTPEINGNIDVDGGLAPLELLGLGLTYDFGAVLAGETWTIPVTIRNLESHPVTFESLPTNSIGSPKWQFSAWSCEPFPSTLAPEETCTADVTWAPTSVGTSSRSSYLNTAWNPEGLPMNLSARGSEPVFVDPSAGAGGSGDSWADPVNSIEDALAARGAATEIWIRSAVIRPSATIDVGSSTRLVGSFAGVEIATLQRDLTSGPTTIITGDLADDDLDPDGDEVTSDADDIQGTNLDRLLESSLTLQLDGLVLTGSDGATPGVATLAQRTEIVDSWVIGNRGPSAVQSGESTLVLLRSLFEGNDAVTVQVESSIGIEIDSCVFRGNRTDGDGAAVRALEVRRDPQYEGMRVRSSLFSGNRASGAGGAIWFEAASTLARSQRGGTSDDGRLVIERSTFVGNRAGDSGGAVSAALAPAGNIVHESIFWDNLDEGPISGQSSWSLHVTNSESMPFSSSDIAWSGGSASWDTNFGTDLGGNVDADPEFVDPVDWVSAPTAEGDFRLWPESPLLDLGSPIYPEEIADAAGSSRLQGAAIDLGAYEGSVLGLRGTVWHDLDGNGQYGKEPGIQGVTVTVSAAGEASVVTTTDETGRWQVSDLADHEWTVSVTLPDGFSGFSPTDVGDDASDSDVGGDGTVSVELAGGAPIVDAGLIDQGEIFADGFESGDTQNWQ